MYYLRIYCVLSPSACRLGGSDDNFRDGMFELEMGNDIDELRNDERVKFILQLDDSDDNSSESGFSEVRHQLLLTPTLVSLLYVSESIPISTPDLFENSHTSLSNFIVTFHRHISLSHFIVTLHCHTSPSHFTVTLHCHTPQYCVITYSYWPFSQCIYCIVEIKC